MTLPGEERLGASRTTVEDLYVREYSTATKEAKETLTSNPRKYPRSLRSTRKVVTTANPTVNLVGQIVNARVILTIQNVKMSHIAHQPEWSLKIKRKPYHIALKGLHHICRRKFVIDSSVCTECTRSGMYQSLALLSCRSPLKIRSRFRLKTTSVRECVLRSVASMPEVCWLSNASVYEEETYKEGGGGDE